MVVQVAVVLMLTTLLVLATLVDIHLQKVITVVLVRHQAVVAAAQAQLVQMQMVPTVVTEVQVQPG
jgi:hypothetical protein